MLLDHNQDVRRAVLTHNTFLTAINGSSDNSTLQHKMRPECLGVNHGGGGPGVGGEGLGRGGKGEMGDWGGDKVSLGRSIIFLKGKI